jgi:CubicO group peptidase (beta-lactamase class C family)
MRGGLLRAWLALVAGALVAASLAVPGSALAAPQECKEPGSGDWTEVTPADAGMDAAKLEAAINYAMANNAEAVRIIRYGCRVASDRLEPVTGQLQFQSWSLAKSITALVFGRAMTQHLVGPDDPLGALVPPADAAHGAIVMRDLLTMTSGLYWNGLRDYNILMPDRISEALTVPVDKAPGTYWEYSQSGPALVAEATQNAVGMDFQDYAQRELFGPLGIEDGTWSWERDQAGHTQGFFGLHMTPDDYARFGELMRLGGVWQGERLLSKRVVSEAITPVAQSGCYGWFIWLNAAKPCVSPRIVDRPVSDNRMFPSLPADLYQFAGLFGQLVTVFPSEGLVVARFGQDNGGTIGVPPWEEEFYRRVLGAITDGPVEMPEPDPDATSVSREDVDRGFFEAAQHPEEAQGGEFPEKLPPKGPPRARAALIELISKRPSNDGTVKVRLRCPPEWPSGLRRGCKGRAQLKGADALSYRVRPGKARKLRFELHASYLRRLEDKGRLDSRLSARNTDRAEGAVAVLEFVLRA